LLSIHVREYEMFIYLAFELKCDVNSVDIKRNNALHVAVISDNLDVMRKLVHLDSDSGTMRSFKNLNGLTPIELGSPLYTDYLVTIWDRVRQGNLHKVRELV
jgi:hypothetical protein